MFYKWHAALHHAPRPPFDRSPVASPPRAPSGCSTPPEHHALLRDEKAESISKNPRAETSARCSARGRPACVAQRCPAAHPPPESSAAVAYSIGRGGRGSGLGGSGLGSSGAPQFPSSSAPQFLSSPVEWPFSPNSRAQSGSRLPTAEPRSTAWFRCDSVRFERLHASADVFTHGWNR